MKQSASLLLMILLLLTGCATPLKDSGQSLGHSWQQRQTSLAQVENWQITGKLGIFTPQGRHFINLFWRQRGDDFSLTFTTALGISMLELRQENGHVWLKDDKGEEFTGTNAEQLITRLTGWHIPLAQLPQWIKGLPGEAQYTLDPDNRLTSLTLNSAGSQWHLSYQGYHQQQGMELPAALEITSQENRIKLAIHKWQIND